MDAECGDFFCQVVCGAKKRKKKGKSPRMMRKRGEKAEKKGNSPGTRKKWGEKAEKRRKKSQSEKKVGYRKTK